MSDDSKIISSEELREKLKGADLETIRKYLKIYGSLTVRLALFHTAVIEKLKIPKTQGYPPGIFISYRWENEEHKKWVLDLANYLKSIGYKVFLDQYDVDLNPESFHEIPNFISSIALCNYFLVIISPGYLDRTLARKGKTSWVFDEYQQALHLVKAGKIKLRAVLSEGKGWLNVCDMFNTVDMRGGKEEFHRIHRIFPPFNGVVLSEQEKNRYLDFLIEVDHLQEAGSFDLALDMLDAKANFQEFFEVKLRRMKSLYNLRHFDQSASIAADLIKFPELEIQTTIDIAEILYNCKKYLPALKKLVLLRKAFKLRETFSLRSDNLELGINYFDIYSGLIDKRFILGCHFLIGNILEDMGSYIGAVNHFSYALTLINDKNNIDKSTLLNNIGFAYRNAKKYEKAIQFFEKSINVNPHNVMPYENLAITLWTSGSKIEGQKIAEDSSKRFPNYGEKFLEMAKFMSLREPKKPYKVDVESTNNSIFLCDECNAEFEIDTKIQSICGDCGSVKPRQDVNCRYCDNDGVVPLLMLDLPSLANIFCPICLKGVISKTTSPN